MVNFRINRRHMLQGGASAALLASGLLPAWARPHKATRPSALTGPEFDLDISRFPVQIAGHKGMAIGVNGSLPAPLLRFREGQKIVLRVHNRLNEDTSIHWHGLLVPFHMDGVPGVSFPGIPPGETFSYRFAAPQSGTYWYHSHSGLQEQLGHYGPIIIDPEQPDHILYDREYVLVLSDWTFLNPHHLFARLKKMSDFDNFNQRTMGDLFQDATENGIGTTLSDRAMWGAMRMSPRDIADVTGASYRYLVNGHAPQDNWTALFQAGERVRLRIINASAMTLFNIRIPGLPMTIVQSDGLPVQPHEIDEFQIGVAETYDVIVTPPEAHAYAFVAESIDASGQALATIAPRLGMQAKAPPLRPSPTLGMQDMGHGGMHTKHAGMGAEHSGMGTEHAGMSTEHSGMNTEHAGMSTEHSGMSTEHSGMNTEHAGMSTEHSGMGTEHAGMSTEHSGSIHKTSLKRGIGIANIINHPISRLDHPGIGLDKLKHRTLRYADLRSLEPNPDTRDPEREIELHLTGNMERYMWSFDGVKFSEVSEAIQFHEGERIRLHLTNHTMMSHPVHLHGMFFDLVNGSKNHKPRKHTLIIKPAEKVSLDVTADNIGDWALHCHLLYHMHAGMMQVVSVKPRQKNHDKNADHAHY